MGLRADSARPQRVSGSARTDNQRAESARNPIASHVNFGDDSALSAFTRTQWTAAFRHTIAFGRTREETSCNSTQRGRKERQFCVCCRGHEVTYIHAVFWLTQNVCSWMYATGARCLSSILAGMVAVGGRP